MSLRQSHIADRTSQILSWQGLSFTVPAAWNPVKIGGDFDQGSLLLADLSSARLGIRWRKASRADPKAWADRALRDEIGALAAGEAIDIPMHSPGEWGVSRLYIDRDPPGRDVFVGWSERSGRVIEMVYNAPQRDDVLAADILPTLVDRQSGGEQCWSIFGLQFTTPTDYELHSYAFNAGDVAMTFVRGNAQLTIRRVGPASLALARRPIDRWVTALPKSFRKMYRPPAAVLPAALAVPGSELTGRAATFNRRRRLCWAWFVPKHIVSIAMHDTQSDRLLLGTSADEKALRAVLAEIAANAFEPSHDASPSTIGAM